MDVIHVPLGQGKSAETGYDVSIGLLSVEDIAEKIAKAHEDASGLAVLVDGNLEKISPRISKIVTALERKFSHLKSLPIRSGESCKTLSEIEKTCQWMAESGFDRGAAVLAIGGGATSDHAGFVAGIYLRGISFSTISTTVLGMVDASVGGKTGVDLAAGKNLVGAFYQPRAVLCDLNFLDTLPTRERGAGMAETVKAGLIADKSILKTVVAALAQKEFDSWQPCDFKKAIADAVRVKVAVVVGDERESGRRAVLNLGHTMGHAMETAANLSLLHGEAVSLGMMVALTFGVQKKITDNKLLDEVSGVLASMGLPVDFKKHINEKSLSILDVDKKRRSDKIRFVFCRSAGDVFYDDIPLADLKSSIAALG